MRIALGRTVTAEVTGQFYDLAYTNIDNAQEPLIFLLEFLLVEDLYCKNVFLFRNPGTSFSGLNMCTGVRTTYKSKLSFQ